MPAVTQASTYECAMFDRPSPKNASVRPCSSPLCSWIVSRSASSWHGWKSSLQRVDHRHAGARGHLLETRLRVRAPDDRGDLALEHPRGVGRRLLAAELAVRGRDDQRRPAEVGDADRERDARAGRGLVEDDRDRLRARRGACSFQRSFFSATARSRISACSSAGEVVVAQQVAGHAVTSSAHLRRAPSEHRAAARPRRCAAPP